MRFTMRKHLRCESVRGRGGELSVGLRAAGMVSTQHESFNSP